MVADLLLDKEIIRVPKGHTKFITKEFKKWLSKADVKTLYIEPGSLWENGYCESFNGKMTKYLTVGNGRNLSMELFDTIYGIEVLMKCLWYKNVG